MFCYRHDFTSTGASCSKLTMSLKFQMAILQIHICFFFFFFFFFFLKNKSENPLHCKGFSFFFFFFFFNKKCFNSVFVLEVDINYIIVNKVRAKQQQR